VRLRVLLFQQLSDRDQFSRFVRIQRERCSRKGYIHGPFRGRVRQLSALVELGSRIDGG